MSAVFAEAMQPITEVSLTCRAMRLSVIETRVAPQFVTTFTGPCRCELHMSSLYL